MSWAGYLHCSLHSIPLGKVVDRFLAQMHPTRNGLHRCFFLWGSSQQVRSGSRLILRTPPQTMQILFEEGREESLALASRFSSLLSSKRAILDMPLYLFTWTCGTRRSWAMRNLMRSSEGGYLVRCCLSLADQSLHLPVEWAISSARHLVRGNENGLPTPDFVLTFLPIDPCEFKGLRKQVDGVLTIASHYCPRSV